MPQDPLLAAVISTAADNNSQGDNSGTMCHVPPVSDKLFCETYRRIGPPRKACSVLNLTGGNTLLLSSCILSLWIFLRAARAIIEVAVTNQVGPGKMTPRSPYPCPIRGGQDLSSLGDFLISLET
eukprot:s78_g11.t1